MGRISFETKDRTVFVSGSMRSHADLLMSKITNGLLDPARNKDLLLSAMPEDHYLHKSIAIGPNWAREFEAACSYGEINFTIGDEKFNSFSLGLNTATAVGNDAVKFLMRVHAQCEMHGYIAGENREWLAQIIENAHVEVLPAGSGWDELVILLRESDAEPVVMSYSVTNGFLDNSRGIWIKNYLKEICVSEDDVDINWTAWEEAEDAWDRLNQEEKWNHAVQLMNETPGLGLELTPQKWPIAFNWSEMTAGKFIKRLQEISTL